MRWLTPILITTCLIFAGCGSTPKLLSVPLEDQDSPLAVVIQAAERSPDRLVAAEVLARAASGYAAAGIVGDSGIAADAAVELLETISPSPETLDIYIRVASVLSAIERPEDAVKLLERSLELVQAFTEQDRASAYVRIVSTALSGSDETRSIVRDAVDQVYVIEDPLLRAKTLTKIAEAYQSSGVGLSVIGLIQQAIPAVRSADDRYERALLFARLAVLSNNSGESSTSASLLANTIAELATVEAAAAGESTVNQKIIADTAVHLAMAGQTDIALTYIDGLGDLGLKIEATIRAAATGPDLAARDAAFVKAAEMASGVERSSAYVDVMTRLAYEYIRSGGEQAAAEIVRRAAGRAADDDSILSDALETLAELHARLNLLEEASELIALVDDPYVRGGLFLTVASELVRQRRGGEADDFFAEAFQAAGETVYLADDLRQRVAAGLSANRSYALAVRAVEQITDPTLRLRAGTELAYHAVVLGGMRDTTREELRLALSGR